MQELLQVSLTSVSPKAQNIIAVDPGTARVSYQQNECCIIFSPCEIHLVQASGLPRAFRSVELAKLGCMFNCLFRIVVPSSLPNPFRLYPPIRQVTRIVSAAFGSAYLTRQHHLMALCISLARVLINKIAASYKGRPHAKLTELLMARLKSVRMSHLRQLVSSPGMHKRQKI